MITENWELKGNAVSMQSYLVRVLYGITKLKYNLKKTCVCFESDTAVAGDSIQQCEVRWSTGGERGNSELAGV